MSTALLLFTMILISVFATGVLTLLVLTKRNRLQLVLAGILGVFLAIMTMAFINMGQSPDHIHHVLSSPLRFRFLVLGLLAFFATMTYYMVAAHRNLLTLRNGILFLSPVLLTLIAYAAWHWSTGVPMDYGYASLQELWDNRFTVPVILRMLMYLFFLLYQTVMFRNMWHLDAMRSEHSILNSPDAVSNIRWLRMIVMGMMAILIAYSFLLFLPSLLVLGIYTAVLSSVFIYFIYNALARPMYEETEGWQAVWTPYSGWKIIEGTTSPKPTEAVAAPEPVQPTAASDDSVLIEQWMKDEKPFCRADFSISEIIARFPNLDYETLNELLQKQDSNPQAFIRRHRIEEACRIIHREKTVKVAELALQVGFSHTSSFSRAFSAVRGETVLQYMEKIGVKRKAKKKNNNNKNNPE